MLRSFIVGFVIAMASTAVAAPAKSLLATPCADTNGNSLVAAWPISGTPYFAILLSATEPSAHSEDAEGNKEFFGDVYLAEVHETIQGESDVGPYAPSAEQLRRATSILRSCRHAKIKERSEMHYDTGVTIADAKANSIALVAIRAVSGIGTLSKTNACAAELHRGRTCFGDEGRDYFLVGGPGATTLHSSIAAFENDDLVTDYQFKIDPVTGAEFALVHSSQD